MALMISMPMTINRLLGQPAERVVLTCPECHADWKLPDAVTREIEGIVEHACPADETVMVRVERAQDSWIFENLGGLQIVT